MDVDGAASPAARPQCAPKTARARLRRLLLLSLQLCGRVFGAAARVRVEPCTSCYVVAHWDAQGVLGRLVETGYRYVKLTTNNPGRTAASLYSAAGIYTAFGVLSLLFWLKALWNRRRFEAVDPGSPTLTLHIS